jgi:hypothetical protein
MFLAHDIIAKTTWLLCMLSDVPLKIYTHKNEKNIFIGFENLKTIKSIIYQHLPIDTDNKYQFSMCNSNRYFQSRVSTYTPFGHWVVCPSSIYGF